MSKFNNQSSNWRWEKEDKQKFDKQFSETIKAINNSDFQEIGELVTESIEEAEKYLNVRYLDSKDKSPDRFKNAMEVAKYSQYKGRQINQAIDKQLKFYAMYQSSEFDLNDPYTAPLQQDTINEYKELFKQLTKIKEQIDKTDFVKQVNDAERKHKIKNTLKNYFNIGSRADEISGLDDKAMLSVMMNQAKDQGKDLIHHHLKDFYEKGKYEEGVNDIVESYHKSSLVEKSSVKNTKPNITQEQNAKLSAVQQEEDPILEAIDKHGPDNHPINPEQKKNKFLQLLDKAGKKLSKATSKFCKKVADLCKKAYQAVKSAGKSIGNFVQKALNNGYESAQSLVTSQEKGY